MKQRDTAVQTEPVMPPPRARSPLAVTCPKCGAKPGYRCEATDDGDWMNTSGWRLMPMTDRSAEAHLHVQRFRVT